MPFFGLFGPPDIKKLKEKKKVRGLIKALGNKKGSVRQRAARALGEIGDARAVEPLIVSLKDSYSRTRIAAANALGKIGDTSAVDPLIDALKDDHKNVREYTAKALGEIGDIRAVDPLIDALHNTLYSDFERRAGLAALGKLGDPRGIDTLILALKYKRTQNTAAKALAMMGERSFDALVNALADNNPAMRLHAAKALGMLGAPQAVDSLIAALEDEESDVQKEAAEALDDLGWQPGEDETSARYWITKGNIKQCVKIGSSAVIPLISALEDDRRHVRREAAEALGEFRDTRAVEPLIATLKHNNQVMRIKAVTALGKIGDLRAVEPLITALKDDEKGVRVGAAKVLGEFGSPQPVRPLINSLADDEGDVRKIAAKALVKLFKSDQLDEKYKQLILKKRESIISDHTDGPDLHRHKDVGSKKMHCHDDYAPHIDRGIGADFPL